MTFNTEPHLARGTRPLEQPTVKILSPSSSCDSPYGATTTIGIAPPNVSNGTTIVAISLETPDSNQESSVSQLTLETNLPSYQISKTCLVPRVPATCLFVSNSTCVACNTESTTVLASAVSFIYFIAEAEPIEFRLRTRTVESKQSCDNPSKSGSAACVLSLVLESSPEQPAIKPIASKVVTKNRFIIYIQTKKNGRSGNKSRPPATVRSMAGNESALRWILSISQFIVKTKRNGKCRP